MSEDRRRVAWTAVSFSTAPVWLAMILAPRSAFTGWLVDRLVPLHATLGAVYTASLAAGIAGERRPPDFSTPDSVQKLLRNPNWTMAAWTHYITFDLFVGRWIWESSCKEGRPARLALLLTWWAGPMGLTSYLARRRFT